MKSFRLISLFLAALLVSALSARAYDTWNAFPQSATTQNLWSVAFANRVLVACGEQGTILTYDYGAFGDEQVWQPRFSGTAVWLVGAGYGNGRFIVVGDRGTILTSDDKGESWTPRNSGTTTRLNSVAYGNGIWIAVGEQGIVLRSTDGTTWVPRAALGSGFLRALAFGQGKFLIGGARGALFSTTDGATFTPVAISTTADIEGAAISPGHTFIAGSGGLRASMTPAGAWVFGLTLTQTMRGIAVRNAEEASAVGETASDTFVFDANGGHWAGNFGPIRYLATAVVQGENEMVAVGFAGNISRARMDTIPSVVSNTPAIYGQDVRFTVVTGTASVGAIQWRLNEVDIPGATQSTYVIPSVTPAKVGAIGVRIAGLGTLSGGAFSVVPGGQPEVRDPAFVSALPVIPAVIAPQPDGKILVAGWFTVTVNGASVYGLARLNADGSIDQTFRPGDGIPTGASISAMHPLPDGRSYIRGSFTSIAGQPRAGLARLLANGAVDPTFVPAPALAAETIAFSAVAPDGKLLLQTAFTGNGGDALLRRLALDGSIDTGFVPPAGAYRLLGVDSSGRVLVAQYGSNYTAPGTLLRLRTDGTRDPAYTPTTVTLAGLGGNDLIDPVVTDTGIYSASRVGRLSVTTSFVHYKADGGIDSSYTPPTINGYSSNTSYRPDGGLWSLTQTGSFLATAAYYGPGGALDPTLYATQADRSTYRIVAHLPDGAFLAVRGTNQTTLIKIRPITGRVGQLTNLAVRAGVTGDPLIAGFVTTGTGTTSAITRAIGPGLAPFSVADAVRDPQLQLVREAANIDFNDNWPVTLAPRFIAVGAFPLPPASRDAALESTITAGNHSAVFTTPAGDTGTGLIELYQSAAFPATRRFVNISARAPVDGAHPLIAGFTITGEVPVKVLIRAAGPALGSAPFNLPGVMADPLILLYRGDTTLWENDNWPSDVADPARRAGAFAFASNSKDSAMLVTLAPGSYTAVLTGVNSTNGTALVEVYEAP